MDRIVFEKVYSLGQFLPVEAVYFLGETLGYLVVAGILVYFILKYKEHFVKTTVITFGITAFSWITTQVLKSYFLLPRPFAVFADITPAISGVDALHAFPSGHATFFAALTVALYPKDKRLALIVLFLTFVISLARVVAGIHYPLDILAGWLLGGLVAFVLEGQWRYALGRSLD